MSEYLWHCPFCNREQTVTEKDRQTAFADLTIDNADGPRRLVTKFVVCPNPECRKFSLSASLHGTEAERRPFLHRAASEDLGPRPAVPRPFLSRRHPPERP